MRIEIVNTGTELMLGQVVNTHAAYFGEELLPLGLRVQRQTCVPDGDAIAEILREAFPRTDVILVTGGLGPTSDDITREIIAEMFRVGIVPGRIDCGAHPEAVSEKWTGDAGGEPTAGHGASGGGGAGESVWHGARLVFPSAEREKSTFVHFAGASTRVAPHVPEVRVRPRLEELLAKEHGEVPTYRTFRLLGVGESHLAEVIEQPLLDLNPRGGGLLRPIGRGGRASDRERLTFWIEPNGWSGRGFPSIWSARMAVHWRKRWCVC